MRTPACPAVLAVLALALSASFAWPIRATDRAASGPRRYFDTWVGFDTGAPGAGGSPNAVASADLDGDGDADLVTANADAAQPGVSVLVNLGGGAYGAPARYAAAKAPFDVEAGDFDGDGAPDVVVSEHGPGGDGTTVALYRNLGAGALGPRQAFAAGAGPAGLAAADFDGDGDLDVAAALFGPGGQGSSVALLRNGGAGSFGAPAVYAAGPAPIRLAAADLNGDGLPDLGVANCAPWTVPTTTQRLSVLLNTGGGFGPAAAYDGYTTAGGDGDACVAAADLDADGDRDLIFSSPSSMVGLDGGVAVFRNQGAGTFAARELVSFGIPFTTGAAALAAGDLNGDGRPDVVAIEPEAAHAGGWLVMLGDGQGGLSAATRYPAGEAPSDVALTDVDGDGDRDAVVVSSHSIEATVHRNPGDAAFAPPAYFVVEPNSLDIDAADVDLDGDLDVATAGGYGGSGFTSVIRNLGGGTFSAHQVYDAPGLAKAVKLRDLDGDGKADLLWADGDGQNLGRWRRNLGSGAFGPTLTIQLPGCGVGDIDALDLDGDGDRDVVATEDRACQGGSARYLDVALNLGGGAFASASRVDLGASGPRDIAAGDFNHDGATDVAVAVYGLMGSGAAVSVLIAAGGGQFRPAVSYAVGQGPEGIVAADVNGDGHLDLATDNGGSDPGGAETVSVLLGRPDGTFFPAAHYPGAYSPGLRNSAGIAAADADADGRADLLVANSGSNDVSLFRSAGGALEAHVRYGANTYPLDLHAGDFTGDGRGDVAVLCSLPPFGNTSVVAIVRGEASASGADTPGLYAPAPGAFFLRDANAPGAADLTFSYGPGGAGWTALTGDWDGDGDDSVGLYDPATGAFFLRNANAPGPADTVFMYGPAGAAWVPVAGDWDGDGDDTVGLYDPSGGAFFLRNANAAGPADLVFGYGPGGQGWRPVVGDWDRDGDDSVGLYVPGTGFFFLRNSNAPGAADLTFQFGPGGAGWTPLAGDWDGDGSDTVGLYDPAAAVYFLRNAPSGGPADLQVQYGPSGLGWAPLVGDWDGL